MSGACGVGSYMLEALVRPTRHYHYHYSCPNLHAASAAVTFLVDGQGSSGNDACTSLLWRPVLGYRWVLGAARSAYGYKPGSLPCSLMFSANCTGVQVAGAPLLAHCGSSVHRHNSVANAGDPTQLSTTPSSWRTSRRTPMRTSLHTAL